ncbi:AAA family ATPase [Ruania suaedae]|uniref:HelD family protein n=1 Tax=Ruania suaedae TaxID=2897774 RepID=UPI001E54C75C|nr:AAA family ATPase [Ruania suaedae]UFU02955.1 AAA family ATPase [Ruania suaedae]
MDEQIRIEQTVVDRLYVRLDALRGGVEEELSRVRREPASRPGDLLDRDARVARLQDRLTSLASAEESLCFGRLDRRDGTTTYVGRIGLRSAELDTLLVDWRAPAAADFYRATPAGRTDVVRRRHLRTRARRVVSINDELLDTTVEAEGSGLVGEGALIEALTAERSGRMNDIVATLQAEQDRIIRSPAEGTLVVQGGPGTGKTAVALHRTAYLLYGHPRLAERGVLVLGPTSAFLDYIADVLPSLGENQAVLATVDGLVPGLLADRSEPIAAAAVKALPVMADVVGAAVRARQGSGHDVRLVYQGDEYVLTARTIGAAVERARRTGYPHNVARRTFRSEVLDHLLTQVLARERQLYDDADRGFEAEIAGVDAALRRSPDQLPAAMAGAGTEVTGLAARHEAPRVRRELAADPHVAAALEALWPTLDPQTLVTELLTGGARLAEAGAGLLDDDHRRALLRAPRPGWSSGDIPLLDEAAELLGEDESAGLEQQRRRRGADLRHARQVIAAAEGAGGGVSAEELADRFAERDTRPLAERAADDRSWAYGHVIVDEAQELTAMQWRMVLRRVPSGSMTVVGDVHQTVSVAGTTSWEALARTQPSRRWVREELTISYRTPGALMTAADAVLHALDPAASPPRCARADGAQPWLRSSRGDLTGALTDAVVAERRAVGAGTLAVIAPGERLAEIAMAVTIALPGASFGPDLDLAAPCVVITPAQAKGLEFDAVVVADPGTILSGPRGLNALYVAMTRPTRRLGVLCDGPVPAVLAGLATDRG